MNQQPDLTFLSKMASAPHPPALEGDKSLWAKYHEAMDKHILDIHKAIEEIDQMDLGGTFKEKLEGLGVNLDNLKTLPENQMKEIEKQVSNLLHTCQVAEAELGLTASTDHKTSGVIKTNRTIQSI